MPLVKLHYPLWDYIAPTKDRYELVMVTSRRAKQINEHRLARQKALGVPVEEATKPTTRALEELKDGFVTINYKS